MPFRLTLGGAHLGWWYSEGERRHTLMQILYTKQKIVATAKEVGVLPMLMLVMLKQNPRSSNSLPSLVLTCSSSQPSASSSKASLKCFHCLPCTSIMWYIKDSFKVKFFSQDLHPTFVLCVSPNSKWNLILRSILKQSINTSWACFALMWTLMSDFILNLKTHRGHWLNVNLVRKTLLLMNL